VSRIQRRVRQAGVYFVTSHTWQRRELFREAAPAEIVVQQLVDCRNRGYYKLHAFVLMPDHFHLLLTPEADTTLEKAMQMIKGGSAHRIHEQLSFRWPVWQPGFHDRWLRDAGEYRTRLNYILQNPVEARLAVSPKDYAWSSVTGIHPMDRSQFDELQGLKPQGKQGR
jgi:REP-associated tyrosine transposase